jgi:hypothetical protein
LALYNILRKSALFGVGSVDKSILDTVSFQNIMIEIINLFYLSKNHEFHVLHPLSCLSVLQYNPVNSYEYNNSFQSCYSCGQQFNKKNSKKLKFENRNGRTINFQFGEIKSCNAQSKVKSACLVVAPKWREKEKEKENSVLWVESKRMRQKNHNFINTSPI